MRCLRHGLLQGLAVKSGAIAAWPSDLYKKSSNLRSFYSISEWVGMLDASQISRRIKLRQLNVFIAVVEHGSMAKAAEHLSISQPVVSKMIASLEQTLGVPLLERGRLGVEPTLYGNAL